MIGNMTHLMKRMNQRKWGKDITTETKLPLSWKFGRKKLQGVLT